MTRLDDSFGLAKGGECGGSSVYVQSELLGCGTVDTRARTSPSEHVAFVGDFVRSNVQPWFVCFFLRVTNEPNSVTNCHP